IRACAAIHRNDRLIVHERRLGAGIMSRSETQPIKKDARFFRSKLKTEDEFLVFARGGQRLLRNEFSLFRGARWIDGEEPANDFLARAARGGNFGFNSDRRIFKSGLGDGGIHDTDIARRLVTPENNRVDRWKPRQVDSFEIRSDA